MVYKNYLFTLHFVLQLIPNELCRRAGIAATWGSINNLAAFPHQLVTHKSADVQSQYGSSEASVFHIREEVILFTKVIRKLVNEATGTFLSVQSLAQSDNPDYKQELLKLSRQYRSIIRACLEDLQEEILHSTNEVEKEEFQSYITIFYSIECIWHLCEILYLEENANNIVVPQILEWVRFHFPKYERKAATLLTGGLIGLESNPDYWETVIGSLMQGRIQVVRGLLKLHSASDSNPFKIVDQILKDMPIYSSEAGVSHLDFNLKWKRWIVDTQSKIDARLFISDPNLDLMMRVVVGEELAWSTVEAQCEAWYELLGAWLFYTSPTAKSFELGQFAKTCMNRMGLDDSDTLKHLDRVLLAALEFDVLQVIKETQHMTDNGWLACHLADLLYHSGRLEELDKGNVEK